MKDGHSDGRSLRRQAEALYGRAVKHCDKGEWSEALIHVDEAIRIDRQGRYVERRSVILTRLGRSDEATAARVEASRLADHVLFSHMEEVLEHRKDGDLLIEQLREGSAHRVEARQSANTSMRTEGRPVFNLQSPDRAIARRRSVKRALVGFLKRLLF